MEAVGQCGGINQHMPVAQIALLAVGKVFVEPIGVVDVEAVLLQSRRSVVGVEHKVLQSCGSAVAQLHVQCMEAVGQCAGINQHMPVAKVAQLAVGIVFVEPIGVVDVEAVLLQSRRGVVGVEHKVLQPSCGAVAQLHVQCMEAVGQCACINQHMPVAQVALLAVGIVFIEPIGVVDVEAVLREVL